MKNSKAFKKAEREYVKASVRAGKTYENEDDARSDLARYEDENYERLKNKEEAEEDYKKAIEKNKTAQLVLEEKSEIYANIVDLKERQA